MKANAPENIYYTPTEDGFYLTTTKPEPQFVEGVEYTRTDAFIDKAKNWLYLQLNEINMEGKDMENFLKDFRNYMKGQ